MGLTVMVHFEDAAAGHAVMMRPLWLPRLRSACLENQLTVTFRGSTVSKKCLVQALYRGKRKDSVMPCYKGLYRRALASGCHGPHLEPQSGASQTPEILHLVE